MNKYDGCKVLFLTDVYFFDSVRDAFLVQSDLNGHLEAAKGNERILSATGEAEGEYRDQLQHVWYDRDIEELDAKGATKVYGPNETSPGDKIKVIHEVWTSPNIEDTVKIAIYDQQDGYGITGMVPAQGYDWSGIRDSSEEALDRMYNIAKEWVK